MRAAHFTHSLNPKRLLDLQAILWQESEGVGEKKWNSYGLTSEERSYLEGPFPFLVGVIADGAHNGAARSWAMPYRLKARIGHLSSRSIAGIPLANLAHALAYPTPLHRYPRQTASFIWRSARHVVGVYNGNTSALWDGRSAKTILGRLLALHGVGIKKANMAVKMLIRDRGLVIDDMHEVNIAPDVIVGRVLQRAGLTRDDSIPEVVRAGKILNPEYPALFDDVIHLTGQQFCHEGRKPDCQNCPLNRVCAKNGVK